MTPLHILIVEDLTLTASDIQETLEKAGHRITAIARNFDEATAAAQQSPPDLAIVDIHLENSSQDGIQTAHKLLNQNKIPIIYLTGHSDSPTVQRAKKTSPAAYLLKPFRHSELVIQVELAYHNFQSNSTQSAGLVSADSVFLPHNKGYEKIAKQQIMYIQAAGAYTQIFLTNEEKPRLVTLNLGYLAQYFPDPNFYRLSRSLIVNLNHIARLESNQIQLSNRLILTIPEGSRAELMKKLLVIRTR